MATDNPRVTAYIPSNIAERLQEYQQQHGLSTSQAVSHILEEYFAGGVPNPESTPPSMTLKVSNTPSVTLPGNWQETVKELIEKRVAALETRLGE